LAPLVKPPSNREEMLLTFLKAQLLGVFVGQAFHQFADGDLDAEFLAQLPRQTLLEGFVRLAFAAGKLP